jgi:hypothetical protein
VLRVQSQHQRHNVRSVKDTLEPCKPSLKFVQCHKKDALRKAKGHNKATSDYTKGIVYCDNAAILGEPHGDDARIDQSEVSHTYTFKGITCGFGDSTYIGALAQKHNGLSKKKKNPSTTRTLLTVRNIITFTASATHIRCAGWIERADEGDEQKN